MKLIKTASGKQQLKISKKEWLEIGSKQGWTKEAKDLVSFGRPPVSQLSGTGKTGELANIFKEIENTTKKVTQIWLEPMDRKKLDFVFALAKKIDELIKNAIAILEKYESSEIGISAKNIKQVKEAQFPRPMGVPTPPSQPGQQPPQPAAPQSPTTFNGIIQSDNVVSQLVTSIKNAETMKSRLRNYLSQKSIQWQQIPEFVELLGENL